MDTQNTSHPLGYWLQAADRFMAAEFRAAFRREGVTRRDWRLLNVIDGSMPARRPVDAHRLRRLLALGWVTADQDGWILTDEGRAAKDRLSAIVDEMRATVTDAVSPEDYATTVATLERIATAFGWEDGKPLPHKRRGRGLGLGCHHAHAGFGPSCHHAHAHGGPRQGFLHDAYERGFDAGFVRGRQA